MGGRVSGLNGLIPLKCFFFNPSLNNERVKYCDIFKHIQTSIKTYFRYYDICSIKLHLQESLLF